MKRTQRIFWTAMGCAMLAAATATAKTDTQEKVTDTGKRIILPSCRTIILPEGTNAKLTGPEIDSGTVVGSINSTSATSAELDFYDRDALLKLNRYDPEDMSESKGGTKRPPAAGKIYLILTAGVVMQRSIGKHDYLLRAGPEGKDEITCLAIGAPEEVLDQRKWQIRNTNTNPKFTNDVRLVFEIPEGTTKVTLVPARPQMFPGDGAGAEITVPADSNPKALKKPGAPTAAPTTVLPGAATPAAEAAPAAGKEQTPEAALTEALDLLEGGQYDKFAKKFVPAEKLAPLAGDAKKVEELALAVRGKLRELKDKKPEMTDDGKTALVTDGGKNKATFIKSGNSWTLRFK